MEWCRTRSRVINEVVITADQMSGGRRVDYSGGSEIGENYVFVVHVVDMKH